LLTGVLGFVMLYFARLTLNPVGVVADAAASADALSASSFWT
jgi:hypothetical protein